MINTAQHQKRVNKQKRQVKRLNKLNEILHFYLIINNMRKAARTQTRINNLINLI